MQKHSCTESIAHFNKDHAQDQLHLKYAAMRSNPFAFLRDAHHLFYLDMPTSDIFHEAPLAWCCGKLHLENFGVHKGDNRLTYFDINDFSETALAPCAWDVQYFLTSILLGAGPLEIDQPKAINLCECFIEAYSSKLREGKALWLERAAARGTPRELLRRLKRRDSSELLNEYTVRHRKNRHLRVDGKKTRPTTAQEREKITSLMKTLAASRNEPDSFQVLDAARYSSDTASLGLERYVILAEKHDSPDNNYLLDIKRALPSPLAALYGSSQPAFLNEAERIVSIQKRMQAIPPAFLSSATTGDDDSYVIKELQPEEDRAHLDQWHNHPRRLENAINMMGKITAWAHLRSSGRQGSATADTLAGFGDSERLKQQMIDLAIANAQNIHKQWEEFSMAFDDGACASEPATEDKALPEAEPAQITDMESAPESMTETEA